MNSISYCSEIVQQTQVLCDKSAPAMTYRNFREKFQLNTMPQPKKMVPVTQHVLPAVNQVISDLMKHLRVLETSISNTLLRQNKMCIL